MGFARYDCAVSNNSTGIESTDSYTANIMFHTILVNMRNIAAISTPIGLPLNRVIKKAIAAGKNPSIGTDCKISIIGMSILDPNGFLAAIIRANHYMVGIIDGCYLIHKTSQKQYSNYGNKYTNYN
jgi:hypothetical protein